MVSAQCRYACFAMRAGNKIAWEESAQIASKYDPETGTLGTLQRRQAGAADQHGDRRADDQRQARGGHVQVISHCRD